MIFGITIGIITPIAINKAEIVRDRTDFFFIFSLLMCLDTFMMSYFNFNNKMCQDTSIRKNVE